MQKKGRFSFIGLPLTFFRAEHGTGNSWSIFPRWVTSDRSDRQLVMEHELFRHLEEESFVRRSIVIAASHFVTDILKLADDSTHALSSLTLTQLNSIDALQTSQSLGGCLTHHYPVVFRRILPDDTLISMASGSSEDWYSVSLVTYAEPRDDFFSSRPLPRRIDDPTFQCPPSLGQMVSCDCGSD